MSSQEEPLQLDPIASRELLEKLIRLVKSNIQKIGITLTAGKRTHDVINF